MTSSLPKSTRCDPCVLCEGTEFKVLSQHDRNGRPLTTALCGRCGLVSHEAIPNDDQLAEYYARHYRIDYHGEYSPSARRVLREWRRGNELVQHLSPYIRDRESVFEVGAGMGCNVKQFELAGLTASGIEPGRGFQQFAERQLLANVSYGFLQDLDPLNQYDVVLLVHVLEHFNQPTQAMRTIRQLLNPGGQLYVEVPNLEAPHSSPGKLFHFAHVYNFTRPTLTMLARKCGFRIKRVLSSSNAKSLMVLLERTDEERFTLDASSYECSRSAISRYNRISYHLRWSYMRDRWQTLRRQHGARLFANDRLARILSVCRGPKQAPMNRAA